jgi:hypothetical protein
MRQQPAPFSEGSPRAATSPPHSARAVLMRQQPAPFSEGSPRAAPARPALSREDQPSCGASPPTSARAAPMRRKPVLPFPARTSPHAAQARPLPQGQLPCGASPPLPRVQPSCDTARSIREDSPHAAQARTFTARAVPMRRRPAPSVRAGPMRHRPAPPARATPMWQSARPLWRGQPHTAGAACDRDRPSLMTRADPIRQGTGHIRQGQTPYGASLPHPARAAWHKPAPSREDSPFSLVNPVINVCQMFVLLYLLTLFYARIPGVRVHKFIVFPYQLVRRVNPYVRLQPEMPCVPFIRTLLRAASQWEFSRSRLPARP